MLLELNTFCDQFSQFPAISKSYIKNHRDEIPPFARILSNRVRPKVLKVQNSLCLQMRDQLQIVFLVERKTELWSKLLTDSVPCRKWGI